MEIANDPNVVTFRDADNIIYKPTGQEMMPIITPAFPSMNTTYAMGASQKRVVLTEFEKAARITAELMKNPKTSLISWKRLFKKFPFFKAYEHFIEI